MLLICDFFGYHSWSGIHTSCTSNSARSNEETCVRWKHQQCSAACKRASPQGAHPTPRRGVLYLSVQNRFVRAGDYFSCSWLRGSQEARMHTRLKLGDRTRSTVHALRDRPKKTMKTTGYVSAEPMPARTLRSQSLDTLEIVAIPLHRTAFSLISFAH